MLHNSFKFLLSLALAALIVAPISAIDWNSNSSRFGLIGLGLAVTSFVGVMVYKYYFSGPKQEKKPVQSSLISNKQEQSYTIPKDSTVFPQYRHPLFLEKSIRYFMTDGFETKNKFYKAIIHDAFQQSPLNTAKKATRLALQTKLSIEKQRALAIVKAYNQLQEVIDKNPEDIVKDIVQDKELFNLLLDQDVKFNQKIIN